MFISYLIIATVALAGVSTAAPQSDYYHNHNDDQIQCRRVDSAPAPLFLNGQGAPLYINVDQGDRSNLVVSRNSDSNNYGGGGSYGGGDDRDQRTLFVFQECESRTVQPRPSGRDEEHGLVRITNGDGSQTGYCLAAHKVNDAAPLTFFARRCSNTDDQSQYKQFWTRAQNGYKDRLTYIGNLRGGHRYDANYNGVVQASGNGSGPDEGGLDFGVQDYRQQF